jgi:hypothetical protein
MERVMKLQDVILKAMARKISWMAAAEIAGVSDRTMRRITGRRDFGPLRMGKLERALKLFGAGILFP